MDHWHAKEVETIFSEIKTSKDGLSKEEAARRLERYGGNKITEKKKTSLIFKFLKQFNSLLIYILLAAMIISFIFKHLIDAYVILAVVLINASVSFIQERKAEKAIVALKKFLIPKSKVIREGKLIEISSLKIVPGDILILNAGDKIPADSRIIESENLQTNEAVLTGESLPVDKMEEIVKKQISLPEMKNILFTGTQIVRGNARAVVFATGMQTEFGKIAKNIQKLEIQKTPMQKRLDLFSKQTGIFILAFVAIITFLGFLKQFSFFEMFLTSVALAVSAIPEGLPAILTIAFAISSLSMSKQNVVIKRLPAVESLGSVTVICSDKTGTMTEEKMNVQEIFTNKLFTKKGKDLFFKNKKTDLKNKELFLLLKTSILCNNARFEKIKDKYEIIGDPTEQALVSNSLDLGLNKKTMIEAEPSIKKFEFDSKRKMMSVLRNNGGINTLYSKGAIEKILSVSTSEVINGQIKNLTEKRKKEILKESEKMEKSALRVLGFACKDFSKKEEPLEKNLVFLGFAGMIDPPRKEVKQAVQNCINAGIKVKMITGDSALTANAIASQIGIKGKTITESQLKKMSDIELSRRIDTIGIFARTTPQQKLRITKALQENGEIVAITGDGVNDSLALKSADIGIAMGKRGTDVSREVSDMVLMDDNFASIVKGVNQGRKTYDNIKKFTKYLLAVNFDEILLILFVLILGMFFGQDNWFLPLLPLQILWINLMTDSLPALALVFEKEEDTMQTQPRREKNLLSKIWKFVLIAGVLAFLVSFVIYLIAKTMSFPIEKTRTMVLTTIVLFELLFVYTCRSNKSLFSIKPFSNKWLNYAILSSLVLHIILLYSPLASAFHVVPLTLNNWLLILPFAVSGLVIFEIGKLILNKRKEPNRN